MKLVFGISLVAIFVVLSASKREPKFAPYVDVTRLEEDNINLVQLKQKYGIKSFSLSFAIGGTGGCEPTWGGAFKIDEKSIIDQIKAFREAGGDVIVSTGGQGGPYVENTCHSSGDLVDAYNKILSATGATHLDLDIETSVPNDAVNQALYTLQMIDPTLTVSFTVMVVDDSYGMIGVLGVDVLRNAVKHGVNVDIVNIMAMDFSSRTPSWGDAVVGAAEATLKQMKIVWPNKSEQELYSMLGVTPMLGHNDNGVVFEISHAKQLVTWAKQKNIGHLGFWSINRDNPCPGKYVGPSCSSIAQGDHEFTQILMTFDDGQTVPPLQTTSAPVHPTTQSANHNTTSHVTQQPTQNTTRRVVNPQTIDCSLPNHSYPHESDCTKYYLCDNDIPVLETCGTGTIWDDAKHLCNFLTDTDRPECK